MLHKDMEPGGRSLTAALVNPFLNPEWDNAVNEHCDATVFHSTAWARVLRDTYGHQPCYVQILLNDRLLALVPMMEVQSLLTKSRGICLPFSDYCAPLVFSCGGYELITEKLKQIGHERGWNYFEVRSHSIIPDHLPASERYYGHQLDLRIGTDALFSNFSASVHRAVRKAQRSGLSTSIQTSPSAVTKFYKLHVRTRRRHGVPPQPRSFFANVQRCLLDAGHGFIVLVEFQKRAVAAAMFLKLGRQAIYKFGASDERLHELRPNNLAMFTGIKRLAEEGAHTLHFGRTDKENDGLRRFKLSWGTTEEEICYARFDLVKESWKQSRDSQPTFHKRVFHALPASLNRLAGAMIYPHLD